MGVSFAGDRPTNELLDDIDRWHAGMDAMLAGPTGCWEFKGSSRQLLRAHRGPDRFSGATKQDYSFDGTFSGRLDEGVWHDLEQVANDADSAGDHVYIPAAPLIGRINKEEAHFDGDERIHDWTEDMSLSILVDGDRTLVEGSMLSSVNLLDEMIDTWAGSTEVSVARWDAIASEVVLERDIPVSDTDQRPIRVETRFPEAGAQAARIDAVWPRVLKLGVRPATLTMRDIQMHIVGYQHDGLVLPRAETISFTASAMGMTASYSQEIRFTSATACAQTSASEPTSEVEAGPVEQDAADAPSD